MLIKNSTRITFPGGGVSATSKILMTKRDHFNVNKVLIMTEVTPFHPLDYNWPDQPSDQGIIQFDSRNFSVEECLTAALHSETEKFLIDQELKDNKIRREDPNWFFLVAHKVDISLLNTTDINWVGREVYLEVDTTYRTALNKSHTACHLASLALNKVTKEFWRKPPERTDSLGNPNLDNEAIVESKVNAECSVDRYRCGKSLRKKGFDDSRFFSANEFNQLESAVNKQLADWIHPVEGLAIAVTPGECFLHEKRDWHCGLLDGKQAKISCGGTHPHTIYPQDKLIVILERAGEAEFTMTSRLS